MRRHLIAAALAALAAPVAAQDAVPLDALSAYLSSITTVEADFTQVNGDGTISTGTIYLHRPGRARFEYDDQEVLVLAGGGQLAIFDGRSNAAPEQYPLRETPLHLILSREIDLGRSDMVVSHSGDGTTTRVVARDPDRPEIGQIEFVFTADPIELRQWVITDQGGGQTTVILGEQTTGERLAARLFSIPQEVSDRER